MSGDRFEILFVCHANICRSPMMERLARQALGPEVTVSSAGTHAWHGAAMHPYTEMVLGERGADARGFSSRPVTAAMLAGAGLVLAAAREQRAACVTLLPAAVRRTFTLRQFGRLASTVEAGGGMARLLDAVRGVVGQPVPVGEDDLADPLGGPVEAFRACADEIQRVLGVIAPT
jgi:protein-tyrosine phosphatase